MFKVLRFPHYPFHSGVYGRLNQTAKHNPSIN